MVQKFNLLLLFGVQHDPTLHDFASSGWPLDALNDRVQKGARPSQHVCSSILCSSESQFTPGTVHSHCLPWLFCPNGALIDSSPYHKVQIWLLCVCFCFQRLSSSHSLLNCSHSVVCKVRAHKDVSEQRKETQRPAPWGLQEGPMWAFCSLCPRPSSAST